MAKIPCLRKSPSSRNFMSAFSPTHARPAQSAMSSCVISSYAVPLLRAVPAPVPAHPARNTAARDDKLQEFGVKNCSWVHSLEFLTSNIKDETESLVTNFFTRLFGLVVAFVFLCSFMACWQHSGIGQLPAVLDSGPAPSARVGPAYPQLAGGPARRKLTEF